MLAFKGSDPWSSNSLFTLSGATHVRQSSRPADSLGAYRHNAGQHYKCWRSKARTHCPRIPFSPCRALRTCANHLVLRTRWALIDTMPANIINVGVQRLGPMVLEFPFARPRPECRVRIDDAAMAPPWRTTTLAGNHSLHPTKTQPEPAFRRLPPRPLVRGCAPTRSVRPSS